MRERQVEAEVGEVRITEMQGKFDRLDGGRVEIS